MKENFAQFYLLSVDEIILLNFKRVSVWNPCILHDLNIILFLSKINYSLNRVTIWTYVQTSINSNKDYISTDVKYLSTVQTVSLIGCNKGYWTHNSIATIRH